MGEYNNWKSMMNHLNLVIMKAKDIDLDSTIDIMKALQKELEKGERCELDMILAESKLKELATRLESLCGEPKESFNESYRDLRLQNESLIAHMMDIENQLLSAKKELESTKEDIPSFKRQIKDLSHSVVMLNQNVADLEKVDKEVEKVKLRDANEHIGRLQKTVEELRKDNRNLLQLRLDNAEEIRSLKEKNTPDESFRKSANVVIQGRNILEALRKAPPCGGDAMLAEMLQISRERKQGVKVNETQDTVKMYRIVQRDIKIQVPCERCSEAGIINVSCHKCGGKGTHFKTIKLWFLDERPINIIKIEKYVSTNVAVNKNPIEEIRYWVNKSDFYTDDNKIIHFTKAQANEGGIKRNKELTKGVIDWEVLKAEMLRRENRHE